MVVELEWRLKKLRDIDILQMDLDTSARFPYGAERKNEI